MVIICIWFIFYPLYYIFLQVLFGVYWIFSIFMDSCQIYYSFSSILYKGNVVIIIFQTSIQLFFIFLSFFDFQLIWPKAKWAFVIAYRSSLIKKKITFQSIPVELLNLTEPNLSRMVLGKRKFILYKWSWLTMGRDK